METTEKFDWSKFTVKTPLSASQVDIINAWTTQEGLEKWFLRLAEFSSPDGKFRERNEKIEAGDTYRWLWHGWPDNMGEFGKVLEPKENEIMRFTFGNAGTVSIEIINQDGETILRLNQENIPLDEKSRMNFYVGCKTGWTFYLLNLKSIIQGGLDLRNKNNKLEMD